MQHAIKLLDQVFASVKITRLTAEAHYTHFRANSDSRLPRFAQAAIRANRESR